ncbi:MAG TPA: PIG-L family deacetylase [Candidatus Hydrogenedentes bacterium]|nr:PIG-L family deacetylase [Candidatus Hydrogenedentota bacterium]
MEFKLSSAQLFVPDGLDAESALARTTHMAIGAHQDDLEIMAYDGIIKCFQQTSKWFCGIVVTNGSGSPRDDVYRDYTDDQMREVRVIEQKKAAIIGEYGSQILLDYPSKAVKDGSDQRPVEDLANILKIAKPEVVYTHNLTDKHDTHIGVTLKVIEAIRSLPHKERPKAIYGCEVWRDLDWMVDSDKVAFDCSAHENLQMALIGVFDSQIAGGKRYDLATMGRRRAHATYHTSHATDKTTGITFGMDLTPLIADDDKDVADYAQELIRRFASDVAVRIGQMRG